MKELIGRVRNKCWIAVLVLVFSFLCCGNMKVYAASCNNHVSGDIEFVWNENHREANVYYICANCRQRYEYAGEAETWLVSYYEPTCTSPGTSTYDAKFDYNGQTFYSCDIYMFSEELGHDFGEWEYKWADDYKSCTATRRCKRDSSHMETYVVKTSMMAYVRTKEPTCTSKGTTRIYALFEDWTRDLETGGYLIDNAYIDVDNIEIDPTAHTGEIILKDKKASNCTEDGYTGDRVYSCCEAVVESGTVLQARGHSYDSGTITKPATCSEQGVKTYTCSVCNDTKTENIAKNENNHTGATVLKNKVNPSCSENGFSGDTYCKDCDTKLSSGKNIEKTGHTWNSGVVTKASTCNQKGAKTYTCQKCNTTKTEDIAVDKTKHTGGTQTKNVVAASCRTTGYTGDVVCYGCGEILSAGQVVEKTQNHKASAPVKENIKDADCTHDGSYDNVSYCEVCHKEMSRTKVETKALGHTWVSSKSAEKTYVCSVCGATKNEEVHSHVHEKTVVPATKNADGKIEWKCACGDVKSSETIRKIKSVSLSTTSYTYNGKNKKPKVAVRDNAGNTISSDFYTVAYKNNKEVGKATVTITMKGNYSGAYTKTFIIVPAKTSVSKLTSISKGFKVKWKKQASQVTGYQIQYSTSKSFKNAKQKLITNNKTTSCSIKKLTAGKKYYVRIRTYKIVDGKKIYSGWSAAKTITTGK